MKMLRKIKGKAMAVCVLVLVCAIWGGMPVSAAEAPAKPELKDPVQNEDNTSEKEEKKNPSFQFDLIDGGGEVEVCI